MFQACRLPSRVGYSHGSTLGSSRTPWANTQQHGWPAVTGAFFQVVDRAEAWEAAARSAAATSRWARAYRTRPSGSVSLAADWTSSSPLPRHHHHRGTSPCHHQCRSIDPWPLATRDHFRHPVALTQMRPDSLMTGTFAPTDVV